MNGKAFKRFCAFSVLTALLQGCAATQPTTGLNETAQHAGTVTMLRVDDAWASDSKARQSYKIGAGLATARSRFVPLRFKENVAGLDGADRIITKDDFVTLTLNSGFIKYFRDPGCGAPQTAFPLANRPLRNCKGEIAVVLSFDDGAAVKESLLVYSSKGQTLGSPLALDDWPIAGPVKITGDKLLIRIVVLELDRAENEQLRQMVKFITNTASTVQPELGPALKITQQLADALIGLNADDVIADKRFALSRAETGANQISSPLLFGKYVLVQQEDELVDRNIRNVSPQSRNPVMISEMRYDTASDRVYRTYPYKNEPCPGATGPVDWSVFVFGNPSGCSLGPTGSEKAKTAPASGATTTAAAPPAPIAAPAVAPAATRPSPVELRRSTLGFENDLNEYMVWDSQNEAFFQALYDSCRSLRPGNVADPTPENGWSPSDYTSVLEEACGSENGGFRFEYPTVLYPDANTLLAQYPLHTHLVFSLDKSTERARRYEQQFKTLSVFLEGEVEAVQDSNALDGLANILKTVRDTSANQESLFRLTEQMTAPAGEEAHLPARKACQLLVKGLRKEGPKKDQEPDAFLAAPVFNEIFHLIGYRFDTTDAVAEHLGKQCKIDRAKETCECPAPAAKPGANDN